MYIIIAMNVIFIVTLAKTISGDIRIFLQKHILHRIPLFQNLSTKYA